LIDVAAVNAGILTADEVREQEGFGPLPLAAMAPPAADPMIPGDSVDG
jgi:hypothetical protein